jgi:hypothetical protein
VAAPADDNDLHAVRLWQAAHVAVLGGGAAEVGGPAARPGNEHDRQVEEFPARRRRSAVDGCGQPSPRSRRRWAGLPAWKCRLIDRADVGRATDAGWLAIVVPVRKRTEREGSPMTEQNLTGSDISETDDVEGPGGRIFS